MTVNEVLDDEKIDMLMQALGLTAEKHRRDDQELFAEASFFAGSISLIAAYLTDEETVVIPRRDVLLILLEAVAFCQKNGVK